MIAKYFILIGAKLDLTKAIKISFMSFPNLLIAEELEGIRASGFRFQEANKTAIALVIRLVGGMFPFQGREDAFYELKLILQRI